MTPQSICTIFDVTSHRVSLRYLYVCLHFNSAGYYQGFPCLFLLSRSCLQDPIGDRFTGLFPIPFQGLLVNSTLVIFVSERHQPCQWRKKASIYHTYRKNRHCCWCILIRQILNHRILVRPSHNVYFIIIITVIFNSVADLNDFQRNKFGRTDCCSLALSELHRTWIFNMLFPVRYCNTIITATGKAPSWGS